MLAHVGIEVGDLGRSRAFYEGALVPLDIKVVMEFEGAIGFGKETERGPNPFFWLNARGRPPVTGAHVCFGARTTDLPHRRMTTERSIRRVVHVGLTAR